MNQELNLSELVEEPTVIEGEGEANRWQKYGKDRIYLNDNNFSGKAKAWIDLQTGKLELGDSLQNPPNMIMQIKDGVATISREEIDNVYLRVQLWDTEEDEVEDASVELENNEFEDATVEPEEPVMEYALVRDVREDIGIDRTVAVRRMRPPRPLPVKLNNELDSVEKIMDGFVIGDIEEFVEFSIENDIQVVDAR